MTGTILLPPSPNWFFINALDSREDDRLLVSTTYKSILVQHLPPGKKLPTLLKVIPNQNEKTYYVCLCPRASEPDYGHTVACVCEGSIIRLFNLHTGDVVAEHRQHEGLSVNGISWGSIEDEEVVVTVGGGGRVVVWQPQHDATHVHTLPQSPELTVVEVNPKDRSQALVAANKDIALLNLKSGRVLTWLKGHDMLIYCIKWYDGEENPFADQYPRNSRAEAMMEDSGKGSEDKDKALSWRQNIRSEGKGPFFASSDHGRSIYFWDVSAKRYVTRIDVPVSAGGYKKHTMNKDKGKLKQHIPLAWCKKDLLSSTVQGELLRWTCLQGKWKYKALHHLHNRAIFNLVVLGDLVVTSGQDRVLHGFDVARLSHMFHLPTLGGYATTLTFCPQDANRLAVGSVDNTVRLLKFGSPIPLQTHTVSHNIKGKILALSWHPEQEGQLLFGTAMGQVGWINVSNFHFTNFAYYHQKSTYKVEWAPPVCSKMTGVVEAWCAYSFGDREIVMRLPSSPIADPLSLKNLVPDPENKKFPKDITEFSFSPDYSYLAVGRNDGQVLVYRRHDLEKVATVVVVKKAVHHILWKPEAEDTRTYTLAVASNENTIQLFCLADVLKGVEEKPPAESHLDALVTQSTRVLTGHEARVVWLAWSPHKPSLLASASYDHTVQLWDTDNGSMLGNYGGHRARVFRVEFSPSDPDLLFSCAEENSLHSWQPSKLTSNTPAESTAILKEFRVKKKEEQAVTRAGEDVTLASLDIRESKPKKPSSVEADATTTTTTTTTTSPSTTTTTTKVASLTDTKKSTSDSSKKANKSFFPKFHTASSRKKGFHHLLLLSLLGLREAKQECNSTQQKGTVDKENGVTVEDDLEDLECDETQDEIEEIDARPIVINTTKKYSFLLEKDADTASPEDILYIMQMYGQPQQMDTLMASEIEVLESKGNTTQANLMHCWRGSLSGHIRVAAKQKKLTPFLVASAPQVSMKLWEVACEAYAEQLVLEGDIVTAASYYLNIHKVEEAVDVLLRHKHYREALAITKSRFGDMQEQLEKVVGHWVTTSMHEGNMDLVASLQLSTGQAEAAARSLSRRIDPGSLFVSAKIYASTGNMELAVTTGLTALKEASVRQEMDKVEDFLYHLPELEWFKVISSLHSLLLLVIQQEDTTCYNYCLESVREGLGAVEGKVCLVEEVKRQWEAKGFSQTQYKDLYQHIVTHFTTQQTPSSVKQLWFLVAVSLCECLLAPTQQLWDHHLSAALTHAVMWGKPDQLLHLTHALLPRGKDDLVMLKNTSPQAGEGETVTLTSLHTLWQCYQEAEVSLIYSHIMSENGWSKLQQDQHVSDRHNKASCQEKTQAPDATVPIVTVGTVVSEGMEGSTSETVKEKTCIEASCQEDRLECTTSNTDTIATVVSEETEGTSEERLKEKVSEEKVKEKQASFSFPHSVNTLKTLLNFYLDNLDPERTVLSEKLGVPSSGSSSSYRLLQEIITLLYDKNIIDDADKESLLSRFPAQ